MMRIQTAHFGPLVIDGQDVFCFPRGLAGLEQYHCWVLLTPPGDAAVSWLQAVDCPKAALGVVDPRRFLPEYQLRTCQRELACLDLRSPDEAHVLVTVNRTQRGLALDLKAPLVVNRERRLGRQVVCNSDLPLQYFLAEASPQMMKRIA